MHRFQASRGRLAGGGVTQCISTPDLTPPPPFGMWRTGRGKVQVIYFLFVGLASVATYVPPAFSQVKINDKSLDAIVKAHIEARNLIDDLRGKLGEPEACFALGKIESHLVYALEMRGKVKIPVLEMFIEARKVGQSLAGFCVESKAKSTQKKYSRLKKGDVKGLITRLKELRSATAQFL